MANREICLKYYFNRKPIVGPWGGGNKILTNLIDWAKESGHEVCYDLTEDVQILFCFDPRPSNHFKSYDDLVRHREKYGSIIVQRVGDVGTHGKPFLTELVKKTAPLADLVVFPSNWAREAIGFTGSNYKVIANAPRNIFYNFRGSRIWSGDSPLRIATHHWSTNEKKGFDFYAYLDEWIVDKNIEFTYIGRVPNGFRFKNARHLPATGDDELIAKALAHHDIYLTASREEAGANHVLEAMAAGLPVIYHSNGGSINEYCHERGIPFGSAEELVAVIREIGTPDKLNDLRISVQTYSDSISNIAPSYYEALSEYILSLRHLEGKLHDE